MAAPLCLDAQEMLAALLRMDTTNPPGAERQAVDYLDGKLREVGLTPTILESGPGRANLVVRIPGSGAAGGPLLVAAHLDVVEADPARWKHPPFSAAEAEGCLWGRGAVDMKNLAAMAAAILRALARDGARLERDLIFAAVADEEAGCDFGSRFLVEEHPELVRADYAIGEVGGFSMHLAGTTFYPVQVAEKGLCWVRARFTGEPGHGSMPRRDSAVVRLGEGIAALGRARMPVHATRYVKDFLDQVAARQPALARPLLKMVARPELMARVVRLVPDLGLARSFGALLTNTASPTVARAGSKTNVIPGVAELEIDGRTLPGQTEADFLGELRAVLGPDVELDVIKSAPPTVTEPIESPLFDVIRRQVTAREPEAVVVPYMIPGFTDAKYFSKLGAKWYGFAPIKIEKGSGIRFADMFHGNDERIPIAGLHWGTEVLDAVIREFCGVGAGAAT
ncbi:MAG: M20/M25/M40 family metallo-hydrolase [Kofleriaceae bacterium]|nr:M20/M25/M40 family metallo-hydrolase [Myxococcales bacterium]MCB9561178.1 M20/M25/M40 family metallo-hydrolase [Kofleriaceae bacterium]MCB9571374.1 M20/M25/M40 family metallo-hydrolase [Kofleriaceae bacterium]